MSVLSSRSFSRTVRIGALALGLSLAASVHAGDFAVIVNKANTAKVDKEVIAKIYTGQTKSWSDGTPAAAVDLAEDNPVRASFSTEMLQKSIDNVKSLWAQLVFSGQALPPKRLASDDEVKKFVAANKGAVGYVRASSLDDSVKVAVK